MRKKRRIWSGLGLILVMILGLAACGEASAPATTAIPTTRPPTATATSPATTPPATATVAVATPTPAQTTVVVATSAPANVTPPVIDTVEAGTTPPARSTISLPKLDAKAEGMLLFEDEGNIWVLSLPDGVRSPLTKNGAAYAEGFNRNPVWSPDSLQIAFAQVSVAEPSKQPDYSGGYDIYTMRPDGSNLKQVAIEPDNLSVQHIPLAWLSNGEILLGQRNTKVDKGAKTFDLSLLDPATAKTKSLPIKDPDFWPGWLAISPDKTQIAFTVSKRLDNNQYQVNLKVAPLSGNGPTKTLTNFGPADLYSIPAFSWSPDGQTLAFVKASTGKGCGEYTIFSVGKDGGPTRELFKEAEQGGFSGPLSFAPGGKWLVFSNSTSCGGKPKLRLLDTEKGGPPLELTTGSNPSYGRKIGA